MSSQDGTTSPPDDPLAAWAAEQRAAEEAREGGLLTSAVEGMNRAFDIADQAELTEQAAVSANDLGSLLAQSGHHDEAEHWVQVAYDLRRESLGPDHTHTLESAANLATLAGLQGRHEEAESGLKRAIAGLARQAGPESLAWLVAQSDLASVYVRTDRVDEAIAILERLFDPPAGHEVWGNFTLLLADAFLRLAPGEVDAALARRVESAHALPADPGSALVGAAAFYAKSNLGIEGDEGEPLTQALALAEPHLGADHELIKSWQSELESLQTSEAE